jgi:transposase
MLQHRHNTRLTPEKQKHGGRRPGAGRPADKENLNPNVMEASTIAREHRHPERKDNQIYQQQQDSLVNPHGRSWSLDECRLLLTLILALIMEYDMTSTDALHLACRLCRRSYQCLQPLWKKWNDEGEVYVVSTDDRGAGAPTHINHSHHISVEAVFHISEYIRDSNGTGKSCTTRSIQDYLLTTLDIKIHQRTLRDILASMGYRYGKMNVIGKMTDSWYVARIRTFLINYSKALNEEAEERCVIVYTDESYVNTGHARRYSWSSMDTAEKNNIVRSSGKGRRLVLLHAFTRDGWLLTNPDSHSDRCDEKALSAELIYEAEKGDGDYHNNMNGSIYMQWLQNRLIPTFKKKYPHRKMILILDNASYHHVRGDDWVNIHSMNKSACGIQLYEWGVNSITVERVKKGTKSTETKVFHSASYCQPGSKYAPTLEELKAHLKLYISSHPEINRTEVYKLFEQQHHELIYTPPYQPGVQPIERLWAYVKNYVASLYQSGRTMTMLLEQTYKGFYGDGISHAGVDATLSVNVIRHSKEYCDYLISLDDELDGNIMDLQTESSAEDTDIVQDIDVDLDPFPGIDTGEDEE